MTSQQTGTQVGQDRVLQSEWVVHMTATVYDCHTARANEVTASNGSQTIVELTSEQNFTIN